MTDRLTVVLEKDIRDDDAQPLIEAIKQMRGVLDVQPLMANIESYIAQSRARAELGQKLWDILYPKT
jgi:hypothetical protein